MSQKTAPATPTLDKLGSVVKERNAIVQFMEWLRDQGIEMASYHNHTDECKDEDGCIVCGISEQRLWAVNKRHEALAHEFLEIDDKAVEKERQALIESIQS